MHTCTYAVDIRSEHDVENVYMETPSGGTGWRLIELRPVSEGQSLMSFIKSFLFLITLFQTLQILLQITLLLHLYQFLYPQTQKTSQSSQLITLHQHSWNGLCLSLTLLIHG